MKIGAYFRIILAAGLLLLSACSAKDYGTIMPRSGGSVEILSHGETAERARYNANEAARLYCQEQGAHNFEVLDHRLTRQGYGDPLVDAFSSAARDAFGSGGYHKERTSSSTTISHPSPGKTVVKTKGTSSSFHVNPDRPNHSAYEASLTIMCR